MQFGDFKIEIIPDTEFRLDGGAMFGVVPKVLWEREILADEHNRIKMNMNCLFIESAGERILVETGIGEKWSDKQEKMLGISRERSFKKSLNEKTGYKPEDISIVVNTHLHFDHAGGNTVTNEEEDYVPQFPNANYFVSQSEFEAANAPSRRDRASYLSENWLPLIKSEQLKLKPDKYDVIPGLTVETVRGHSATMQTVSLKSNGKTLYSFSDLVPTRAHLKLPWIAAYDLFPLETLDAKKRLLAKAIEEDWICLFYHDLDSEFFRLRETEGKIEAFTA